MMKRARTQGIRSLVVGGTTKKSNASRTTLAMVPLSTSLEYPGTPQPRLLSAIHYVCLTPGGRLVADVVAVQSVVQRRH